LLIIAATPQAMANTPPATMIFLISMSIARQFSSLRRTPIDFAM
jgi:hypothetical protein